MEGQIEHVLPEPSELRKLKPVVHHPAIPVGGIGAFVRDLRAKGTVTARCLEFTTLNASRRGEARGARWPEFDLEAQQPTWTIPGKRMKGGKEHMVPLSRQAVALLNVMPRFEHCDLVFPSRRANAVLPDMKMLELTRGMKADGVPHGMRSTFGVWAAKRTNYPPKLRKRRLPSLWARHRWSAPTCAIILRQADAADDWADFLDRWKTPSRTISGAIPRPS